MAGTEGNQNSGSTGSTPSPGVAKGPSVPVHYPMLSDTNYGIWEIKMKILLKALGVWEAIDCTGEVDEEKDKGALAAISQSVPDSTIMAIASKLTAKDAWKTIKEMAVGEERVKKARAQVLKRQFDRLIMSDTVSLTEFSQLLVSLVGEMRTLGVEMQESVVVDKLFSAVPDRFMPIISTIEQWGDTSKMTVAEAIGRLRVFEEGLKSRQQPKEEEGEKLLLTRAQWEAMALKERKNENSDTSKPKKKFDKSKIKCFNCSVYGHFASECRKPRKDKALMIEREEGEESALLMHQVCVNEGCPDINFGGEQMLHLGEHQSADEDMWYLDSGASNHMCGNLELFATLDKNFQGTVKLGNGSRVSIGGIGTVLIEGKGGEHKVVTDVYYISQLKSNIISLGQLEEHGCKIEMSKGHLLVFDTVENLLMKVKRNASRLYKLNLKSAKPVCLMSSAITDDWKWHIRFGHVNFQALERMSQQNLVKGLPPIKHVDQVCEGCLVGKQRRNSFPVRSMYRASEPLELVHGDLCGPISPSTPAGSKFFLLLVDDYSRYMWIVLLTSKDKTFQAFRNVKVAIEVEQNRKLRGFRTDRGGEFKSLEFEEYCNKHGVKRFMTAPYSPQQNGVVERRNQTVVGIARSMLKAMKMPLKFWGEAVTTAVYILNRVVTKSLEGMTPYEAWHARKPSVHHMRTFGCTIHVKTVTGHLKKLDDRSTPMVFLGYEKGSKVYRAYNPVTKKVIVTRDAIFEEDKPWSWTKTEQEQENEGTGITSNMFQVQVPVSAERENHCEESNSGTEIIVHEGESNSEAVAHPDCIAQDVEVDPVLEEDRFEYVEASNQGGLLEGGNESDDSAKQTPVKWRRLSDLYSSTEPNMELGYCMIGVEEPLNFDEAVKEESWRTAMKEE